MNFTLIENKKKDKKEKSKINHKKFLYFYSYYFIIIFEVKYQVLCYLYHHEIHKILK